MYIPIIILGSLIIIVIFMMTNTRARCDLPPTYANEKRWAVLLTTCVYPRVQSTDNPEQRAKQYLHQVYRWLNETNLDIFVVDSSNSGVFNSIDNARLTIISFKPAKLKTPENYTHRGYYEALSIMKALRHISHQYTHILKVTGRYFLDGVEKDLYKNDNYDLYLQKNYTDFDQWQNCEYFGIRRHLLPKLLQPRMFITNPETPTLERELYAFSKRHSFVFIGPFRNDVARGGDGKVYRRL